MSSRMDETAEQIRNVMRTQEQAEAASLAHMRDAGEALLEARSLCAPKEWGRWLQENCPTVSARAASRYMRIAKGLPSKALPRNGVIYFVHAGAFIKIGFTSSPLNERIAGLQSACPYPIKLLGVIQGNYQLERVLHKRFAEYRAHGEWFHAADELIEYISETAQ